MPIVTINGFSQRTNVDLKELKNQVRLVISQVAKLDIKSEQVSVFIPFDLCIDVEEIIVTIIIYQKPERTDTVLQEMSSNLARFLKEKLMPGILVEVNVVTVDPKHCSSSPAA